MNDRPFNAREIATVAAWEVYRVVNRVKGHTLSDRVVAQVAEDLIPIVDRLLRMGQDLPEGGPPASDGSILF